MLPGESAVMVSNTVNTWWWVFVRASVSSVVCEQECMPCACALWYRLGKHSFCAVSIRFAIGVSSVGHCAYAHACMLWRETVTQERACVMCAQYWHPPAICERISTPDHISKYLMGYRGMTGSIPGIDRVNSGSAIPKHACLYVCVNEYIYTHTHTYHMHNSVFTNIRENTCTSRRFAAVGIKSASWIL